MSRRKVRWIAGSVVLFALVVGVVVYRPAHEPVARMALPDGTELRVEYVTYGTEHQIPGVGRFVAWASRLAARWPRLEISEQAAEYRYLTDTSQLVLWLTIYDPKARTFSPGLGGVHVQTVNEPDYLADLRLTRHPEDPKDYEELVAFDYMGPTPHLVLPVDPYDRRNAKLRLRIEVAGAVSEMVVPNPAAKVRFPEWRTEALPQSRRIGELELVLRSLTTLRREDNQSLVVTPEFDVLFHGKLARGLTFDRWVFTDATGNKGTTDSPPPLSERAWKVETTLVRTGDYPFAADEGLMFGPVPMPDGGKYEVFSLPDEAANKGLRLAVLLGPGWYVWKGGTFLEARGAVTEGEAGAYRGRPEMKDALMINTTTSVVVFLFVGEADGSVKWIEGRLSSMVARTLWDDHAYGLPVGSGVSVTHSFPTKRVVETMVYEVSNWKGWPPAVGTPVRVQCVPLPVTPERVEFLVQPPKLSWMIQMPG